MSPVSACTEPTSRSFEVVCDGTDNCDDEPDLEAVLLVTVTDVDPITGECESRVEELQVECGKLVHVVLTAEPCPDDPPSDQRCMVTITPGGVTLTGEEVVLQVSATDDCGNTGTAEYYPAPEPSPLCEIVLENGECCPAIVQPGPGKVCLLYPCSFDDFTQQAPSPHPNLRGRPGSGNRQRRTGASPPPPPAGANAPQR